MVSCQGDEVYMNSGLIPVEMYSVHVLGLVDYFETTRLSVQSDPNITLSRICIGVQNLFRTQESIRFMFPKEFATTTDGEPRWKTSVADVLNSLVETHCITRTMTGSEYTFTLSDVGRRFAREYRINLTFDGVASMTSTDTLSLWDIPQELVGMRAFESYQNLRPNF